MFHISMLVCEKSFWLAHEAFHDLHAPSAVYHAVFQSLQGAHVHPNIMLGDVLQQRRHTSVTKREHVITPTLMHFHAHVHTCSGPTLHVAMMLPIINSESENQCFANKLSCHITIPFLVVGGGSRFCPTRNSEQQLAITLTLTVLA